MQVTNDQVVRFKNMVHDFAVKHHLYHRFFEYQGELDRLEVEFFQYTQYETKTTRTAKTYAINFLEVRSLTEAATPMFADALVRFRKIDIAPECCAPTITNVIYNPPATVVFWSDGSKTVVKCGENDTFDPEKGLVMAISKKMLGNQGNYYNEFKKWTAKCEVESLYPKTLFPNSPFLNKLADTAAKLGTAMLTGRTPR